MEASVVRIICAGAAVLFAVILFLRRRSHDAE
jgi:hypothetical protein